MKSKGKYFIEELNELLKKYKAGIYGGDNYDGEESYCGTSYYISGENLFLEISDIEKELDELNEKH